jgi:hypothetical protein
LHGAHKVVLDAPAEQADRHTTRARRADYKDVAVETLSDSEALLIERVASLECDVRAYRATLVETLHALHFATVHRDRLRAQLRCYVNVGVPS